MLFRQGDVSSSSHAVSVAELRTVNLFVAIDIFPTSSQVVMIGLMN